MASHAWATHGNVVCTPSPPELAALALLLFLDFGIAGTDQRVVIVLELFDQFADVFLGYAKALQKHASSNQRAFDITRARVFNALGYQLVLVPQRAHTHVDVQVRIEDDEG